jgi:hypothetical protein
LYPLYTIIVIIASSSSTNIIFKSFLFSKLQQRIRLSRNKIVSIEAKSLDKTTFLTLIDEFREIAKRVDFYLKKDVKFLLQIQPTESMTKAEIESTVEEIRRLPVIEGKFFFMLPHL